MEEFEKCLSTFKNFISRSNTRVSQACGQEAHLPQTLLILLTDTFWGVKSALIKISLIFFVLIPIKGVFWHLGNYFMCQCWQMIFFIDSDRYVKSMAHVSLFWILLGWFSNNSEWCTAHVHAFFKNILGISSLSLSVP